MFLELLEKKLLTPRRKETRVLKIQTITVTYYVMSYTLRSYVPPNFSMNDASLSRQNLASYQKKIRIHYFRIIPAVVCDPGYKAIVLFLIPSDAISGLITITSSWPYKVQPTTILNL